MPSNWVPTQEGDSLNAASLNTPMGGVRDEINALDEPSIKRYSLNSNHLPSQVLAYGHKMLNPGAVHIYTSLLHPYPGWNTLAGWSTVNTAGSVGGGTELEAVLNTSVDLAASGTRGLLVYCNIQLQRIYDSLGVVSAAYYVIVALHVRLTTAAYIHIARTERYSPSDSNGAAQLTMWKDLPIRTLIKSTDLGATTTVDRVKAVVSVADSTGAALNTTNVELRRGNISAIALRGAVLT